MRWFHVILTTYGSWLPGDPRGFRTRHHRRHVEGDYKNPPEAGRYDRLHQACRRKQKQPSVALSGAFRVVVAHALQDKLIRLGAVVAVVAVARRHVHLLAKLPEEETRRWIGLAKRHATFTLREKGWNRKLWAGGAQFVPLRDRSHQLNVYQYIVHHVREGAFVLKWGDTEPAE